MPLIYIHTDNKAENAIINIILCHYPDIGWITEDILVHNCLPDSVQTEKSFFQACKAVCFYEHKEVLLFSRDFVRIADRFSEFHKTSSDFPDHIPAFWIKQDVWHICGIQHRFADLLDSGVRIHKRFCIRFFCKILLADTVLPHVPYRRMHSWHDNSDSSTLQN